MDKLDNTAEEEEKLTPEQITEEVRNYLRHPDIQRRLLFYQAGQFIRQGQRGYQPNL